MYAKIVDPKHPNRKVVHVLDGGRPQSKTKKCRCGKEFSRYDAFFKEIPDGHRLCANCVK